MRRNAKARDATKGGLYHALVETKFKPSGGNSTGTGVMTSYSAYFPSIYDRAAAMGEQWKIPDGMMFFWILENIPDDSYWRAWKDLLRRDFTDVRKWHQPHPKLKASDNLRRGEHKTIEASVKMKPTPIPTGSSMTRSLTWRIRSRSELPMRSLRIPLPLHRGLFPRPQEQIQTFRLPASREGVCPHTL